MDVTPRCEMHQTDVMGTSDDPTCTCMLKAAPTVRDSIFKLVGMGGCRDRDNNKLRAFRSIQASGLEMCMADCIASDGCAALEWFPSSWAGRLHENSRHAYNCQLLSAEVSHALGTVNDFHCYQRVQSDTNIRRQRRSQRRSRARRSVVATTRTAVAPTTTTTAPSPE